MTPAEFALIGIDASTIAFVWSWGFGAVIFSWSIGFCLGVALKVIRSI